MLLGWFLQVFCLGNTHVVIPGQVYRGAQLSPEALEDLVERYGIRTVVNLRGCSDAVPWYLEECQAAQRLGLNLEDIGLSAYRFPNETQMRALLDVLERAEYPIYLHCRRGSDRTGLAAATALLLKGNVTPAAARRQLSLRYGHAALGNPAYLNWFFDIYTTWLKSTQREHTPAHFAHWLRHEYRGGWYKCAFANFEQETPRAWRYTRCRVEAHNIGLRDWRLRPVRVAGMHLNYWVRNEKDQQVAYGNAGLLEATVPPGGKLPLTFAIPPLPKGRYHLFATMEDAKNFHLYQTGSQPLEVTFEVH
jgi:protein tyrosine phosphatase (PTP) superfamily phosphohydrolase (DUF442 family)